MENVYARRQTRVKLGSQGWSGRIYYICRWSKDEYITPLEIGKRKRDGASQKKCRHCPVNNLVAVIDAGWVTFEVPKVAQEAWPAHNHDLSWCDEMKINLAVRDALKSEIQQGYPVSQVLKLFTGEWQDSNRVYLEACGGKHLAGKLGYNVAREYLKANQSQRRLGAKEDWQDQVDSAMHYLQGQEGWKYQQISAVRQLDEEVSNGLVFACEDRIQTLCRRGYLTLLDSTHCTNKLGWFLFTLVVRDEQGSYIPCGGYTRHCTSSSLHQTFRGNNRSKPSWESKSNS
jgi:hypothetical protein